MRTPFVAAACLGFLIGVAIASARFAYADVMPSPLLWGAAGTAGVLITALRRSPRSRTTRIIAIGGIALAIGIARFAALPVMPSDGAGGSYGVRGVVEGTAVRITERADRTVLVRMTGVTTSPTSGSRSRAAAYPLPFLVTFASWDGRIQYGDTIRFRCTPHVSERPGDRLTIAGRCTVRDARQATIVATGGGSRTVSALIALRDAMTRTVTTYIANPASGITNGVLLGVSGGIPNRIRDAFRATGTIHVLVVSGWHMSFIGLLVRRWLAALHVPQSVRLLCVTLILGAFTVMVGISATAVRGALIVIAIMAVEAMGRIGSPARALLLVATAMAIADPRIVAFDLSAQLSFAATAGLLLLTPILSAWARVAASRITRGQTLLLRTTPACLRSWGVELRELFLASCAASLATAPLILWAFGTFAPFAPLINVPVLLGIPAIMASGVAVIAVAGVPMVAAIAGNAGTIFGNTVAGIVEWAARLPGAAWAPSFTLDGWFIAGMYACALAYVVAWHRRRGIAVLMPTLPGTRREELPILMGR